VENISVPVSGQSLPEPFSQIAHRDIPGLAVLGTVHIAPIESLAHVDEPGFKIKVLFLKPKKLRKSAEDKIEPSR
jgi:hypothetical protein